MCGVDLHLSGQFGRDTADRMVLRVGQFISVLGAEQVSAPGGPVEHGAAGEDCDRLAAPVQNVTDVVMSMPWGVHDLERRRSRVDDIAVDDCSALVFDRIAVRDDVFGTRGARKFQAASDVVVVDVSFPARG